MKGAIATKSVTKTGVVSETTRQAQWVKKVEFIQKHALELQGVEYKAMEVYDPQIDFKAISPSLRLCTTKEELSLWRYFHTVASSWTMGGIYGKRAFMLLWDDTSNTVLGTICLSNDVPGNPLRDKYIGWSKDQMWRHFQSVRQLQTCVPLQPFGSMRGGKLLALSAYSNESIQMLEKAHGIPQVGISCYSLYGESIQYDRLPVMKYLGETKRGTGIYWGYTAEDSKKWLSDEVSVPKYFDRPLESFTEVWRSRWFKSKEPKKEEYRLSRWGLGVFTQTLDDAGTWWS